MRRDKLRPRVYFRGMNDFGKALKVLREKQSLTLREVQARSGVSRQSVLRAEGGEFINFSMLLKLLNGYKLVGAQRGELMKLWVREQEKKMMKLQVKKKAPARSRVTA